MKHQTIRNAFLSAVLIYTAIIPSFGQQGSPQKTDIDALLGKLRSNDGEVRAQAYEQLKSDPTALRSAKVKAVLLDLLDRENRENDSRMREAQGPSQETKKDEDDGKAEEMAEYFSELDSSVDSFADWTDPHQACILVKSGDVPASHSSKEAALWESIAWPCLKEMSVSDLMLRRADASRILVDLSAQAGDSLDPAIAQETKQIIVHALHDQNESVRTETVESLEKFGTEDMIPVLKEVAESDPAIGKTTQSYWIRGYAAKAIAAIQKRAGQH